MHNKKRMAFSSAIVCSSVAALFMTCAEKAHATDFSQLGLVYVSGTATSQLDGSKYSVNIFYVRLPGSSTWLPGAISIFGNGVAVTGNSIASQPFLANMGPWEDAFISQVPVTFNGQSATLTGILQGSPLSNLIFYVSGSAGSATQMLHMDAGSTVILNP